MTQINQKALKVIERFQRRHRILQRTDYPYDAWIERTKKSLRELRKAIQHAWTIR